MNPGDAPPVYYGFGLTIRPEANCTWVAHSGAWQGFRSYYAFLPERHLSVVVLANLDSADAATIGKRIIESLQPDLKDGRDRADDRIP